MYENSGGTQPLSIAGDAHRILINDFLDTIQRDGVTINMGLMSTVIAGEREKVLQAVSDGFARVSDECDVVLQVTFSNACLTSIGESCTGPGRRAKKPFITALLIPPAAIPWQAVI